MAKIEFSLVQAQGQFFLRPFFFAIMASEGLDWPNQPPMQVNGNLCELNLHA